MIVSCLEGGLGNQMFQYAAGRALAKSLGTTLSLDLSFFSQQSLSVTPRDFELGCFNIEENIIDSSYSIFLKLAKKLPFLFNILNQRVLVERNVDFMPDFFKTCDGTRLIGYWQSYKYFADINDDLFAEFQPRSSFCLENEEFAQKLTFDNHSIALHIRCGDYLNLPSATNYHGNLTLSYYQDAINFIHKHDELAKIIIFSDDIDWCKIHFKELQNVDFAPSPISAKPWEDMVLMSLCRGNIIANSSYSWWSAWLGDMRYGIKDRQVIAPNRWFSQQSFSAADRFPPHWMLI
jgi:hypothetical protein